MDLQRISTCNYPVRDRDLDYTFKLIADAGYKKIDLWGGLPNYSNDPDEYDVAALKAKAEKYGLRIANLGTYPGGKIFDIGPDAEFEEMERAIDNAAFLGSRSIRVSPGTGEDPAIIPELVPFFQKSAAYAADRGVYLGMENHKGSIAGNPDACAELSSAVGSPHFGVLYEPANLMHCGVDYKDAYAAFGDYITHIHVKDSQVIDGKYERTMLGEGDIDYAWVVATLEAGGYTGDYALEFEIQDKVDIAIGLPKWLEYFLAL